MSFRYVRNARYGSPGVALALLLTMSSAWGQSAGQWSSPEKIYGKVCAYCHETAVAPRLFGRNLSAEYVRHVVLNGQRAMPAFRPTDFSGEELKALAQFVQARSAPWGMPPGKEPASSNLAGGPK